MTGLHTKVCYLAQTSTVPLVREVLWERKTILNFTALHLLLLTNGLFQQQQFAQVPVCGLGLKNAKLRGGGAQILHRPYTLIALGTLSHCTD